MSAADVIAPQLPFLRRYARALTGSQDLGDRQVAALLESLRDDPGQLDPDLPPRVAVYALFSQIFNAKPASAEQAGETSVADRRLGAMTPRARQAFLLTAMEGFSPDEAAEILEVTRPELDELMADAGTEIGRQVATRVLIIEDEPIIAMDLESLVESLGHRVIGTARTQAEALALVGNEEPGLVLADIQLADGSSGLDAVNHILASVPVPIVFITAYPEVLLTGRRPEPTFLIAKPFRHEMVRAVVSQALFFDTRPNTSEALDGTARRAGRDGQL